MESLSDVGTDPVCSEHTTCLHETSCKSWGYDRHESRGSCTNGFARAVASGSPREAVSPVFPAPVVPRFRRDGHFSRSPFAVRPNTVMSLMGSPNLSQPRSDGAGPLRVVEPALVARALRERGILEAPDVQAAANISAQLGADAFVLGFIVEAAGRLRASCVLHSGARVVARVQSSGDAEDDLFQMVDGLARGPVDGGRDPRSRSARAARLAARTTSSVAALKAYLRGASG